MMLSHKILKERQRKERADHPEGLALRVHRALSWLDRSEQCSDIDGRFIFLWIAFNAAYAQNFDAVRSRRQQQLFNDFLAKLLHLDQKNIFFALIWEEFSSSVRLLLDNEFVFKPFWDYQNGELSEREWKAKFDREKRVVNKALSNQNTITILGIVLSRMYVLRNQMVHGGATWNSGINRNQIRDSCAFLAKLVPFVIEIMLDHPHTLWGDAVYPPIDSVVRSSKSADTRVLKGTNA
jgi:hypothetical protein